MLQALNKADTKTIIRDASKEVTVRLKKQAIISPEFLELWNKIKQKTTYRVNFDLDVLVANCITSQIILREQNFRLKKQWKLYLKIKFRKIDRLMLTTLPEHMKLSPI